MNDDVGAAILAAIMIGVVCFALPVGAILWAWWWVFENKEDDDDQ
jgi:hypothetical protein